MRSDDRSGKDDRSSRSSSGDTWKATAASKGTKQRCDTVHLHKEESIALLQRTSDTARPPSGKPSWSSGQNKLESSRPSSSSQGISKAGHQRSASPTQESRWDIGPSKSPGKVRDTSILKQTQIRISTSGGVSRNLRTKADSRESDDRAGRESTRPKTTEGKAGDHPHWSSISSASEANQLDVDTGKTLVFDQSIRILASAKKTTPQKEAIPPRNLDELLRMDHLPKWAGPQILQDETTRRESERQAEIEIGVAIGI